MYGALTNSYLEESVELAKHHENSDKKYDYTFDMRHYLLIVNSIDRLQDGTNWPEVVNNILKFKNKLYKQDRNIDEQFDLAMRNQDLSNSMLFVTLILLPILGLTLASSPPLPIVCVAIAMPVIALTCFLYSVHKACKHDKKLPKLDIRRHGRCCVFAKYTRPPRQYDKACHNRVEYSSMFPSEETNSDSFSPA